MEGGPGYSVGKWGEDGAAGFCGSGGSSVRVRLCVDKRERRQCMGLRLKEEKKMEKSPSLLRVQGRRRKSQRDWGLWPAHYCRDPKKWLQSPALCPTGDEKK
uniref:Uncharacterized protein n=1 Tax=Populus alba TaxID=43335 RepID=A0A4U5PZ02_POPAL|nr:hypothetical protein D5086_0000159010 [Populus alba]TKS02853.1 hypothetical protein D5086_0000159020 [Populus alba]